MKMKDKRLKKLDSIGVRAQRKPMIKSNPVNRSERRALARMLRKAKMEQA